MPEAWFALSSSALARTAVEGKDGYTILCLPSVESPEKDGHDKESASPQEPEPKRARSPRYSLCWEFVGASTLK